MCFQLNPQARVMREDQPGHCQVVRLASLRRCVFLCGVMALFLTLLGLSSQGAKAMRAVLPNLATLPATSPSSATPAELMSFVWAIDGAPNNLSFATDVAADGQGNVYVSDSGHDRIQKFGADGRLLAMWGNRGSGDGQFVFTCVGSCPPICPPLPTGWDHCPHLPGGGIAVDGQGNILVSDYNARIQKFDSNGKFLLQWGSRGTGEGQFDGAEFLAVDGQNNVYVTDFILNRVEKFDSNGKFLLQWGTKGSGEGQFDRPIGIAVDGQGDVYVGEWVNHRIQKFDGNGRFLTMWGTTGSSDSQLKGVQDVAVDVQGNVYVVDNPNMRVVKFDGSGKFLGQWGRFGSGDGEFDYPSGIAVDPQGNIYVSTLDSGDSRLQKFRAVDA